MPQKRARHTRKSFTERLTSLALALDSIATGPLFSEKNRPLWDINSPARCEKACGALPALGPRAPQMLKWQPPFSRSSAGLPGAGGG